LQACPKSLPLRVWHAIATDRVKRAKLLQFLRQEFPLEEWRYSAEASAPASASEQDGMTDA
jgi:hypothetical protein